jgi:hypothetical protein
MSSRPNPSQIAAEVERWSRVILDSGISERWSEGAIFPREMAFFLGCASASGAELIIESGRQDGYSTEILGFIAQAGTRVVSIDYEDEKARGERCRQRLKHLPVEMIVGDAFEEIGRLVQKNQVPTALLIDGPKSWGAISIAFAASAWPQVRVIALHNLPREYSTRKFFEGQAGTRVVYEDILQGQSTPAWLELGARESTHSTLLNAGRTLEDSSLGLIILDDGMRARLPSAWALRFRFYPPVLVKLCWKIGAYGFLKSVFRLTNRVFGYEKAE